MLNGYTTHSPRDCVWVSDSVAQRIARVERSRRLPYSSISTELFAYDSFILCFMQHFRGLAKKRRLKTNILGRLFAQSKTNIGMVSKQLRL